jgi:hypothetical protein
VGEERWAQIARLYHDATALAPLDQARITVVLNWDAAWKK